MRVSDLIARKNWPWLAILATTVLMVLQLRLQGRIWFCERGDIRIWVGDPSGPHTSQHLFDPYTFTHIQHGFLFLLPVQWLFKRMRWQWQMWLVLFVEAVWEVIENTEWVINRYRDATAAHGYTGDSIVNVLGVLLACWLGIMVVRWFGWKMAWAAFVVIEVVLIFLIRDSLFLNVIMLFLPIQALKEWQMGA